MARNEIRLGNNSASKGSLKLLQQEMRQMLVVPSALKEQPTHSKEGENKEKTPKHIPEPASP